MSQYKFAGMALRNCCRPLFKSSNFMTLFRQAGMGMGPGPGAKPGAQKIIYRSFRSSARLNNWQATPFENNLAGGSAFPNKLLKAVLFTGAFSVGTFMGVSIMEYESTRQCMFDKINQSKFGWLRRKLNPDKKWEMFKNEISRYWNELTPAEKVYVPILALNVLVYGLWRFPSMHNIMIKYFTSNPASHIVCWPMLLSTFSHYSFFHLAANMYVLHGFTTVAVESLGKEQFLAVYLTAGVFSSLVSMVYKTMISQSALSLGASGAIMAILAYVCAEYPDTQVGILFLPKMSFSAGSVINAMIGIDLVGCVMGWKFFDHAAHLGGAIFGLLWASYGNDLWQQRLPFLAMYHELRKTK